MDKVVKSLVSGRSFPIHKELSKKEAELVEKKIQQLAEIEKAFKSLDKELGKVGTSEARNSLIKKTDIYQKKLDLIDSSKRVQTELDEMLSSTLRHCFNLTIVEIDAMDVSERQQIFLKLTDACR